MPDKEKAELQAAAAKFVATNTMTWMPSPGPQTDAYLSEADILLFGGGAGGGKLQPLDAKVLTPFGWRTIGSLKISDQVSDPTTGGVTRVIGIYPQGILPIYRIVCDDGATTEVGLDHLWAYHVPRNARAKTKPSDQRKYASSILGSDQRRVKWNTYRVGTTKEMLAILKGGQRPRIPLLEPILFSVNGRTGKGTMPPYLAGIMLGDGCHQTKSVTSCDNEVRDYLVGLGFSERAELWKDGRAKAYGAKGAIGRTVDAWLRNHGLRFCRSWEKFIPDYVFTASIEYRVEFLRGLMDTDGTVDGGCGLSFCSTSLRLADGVTDLVRGLGGKATKSVKKPTYTSKGEKLFGRDAYNLYIWLPAPDAVFNIKRKKDRCVRSWNDGSENMRAIESIELSRKADAVCIKVDSPYGLYVTDDYIVTHNTDLLLGLAFNAHERSLLMRREYTDLGALTERAIKIKGSKDGFNGSAPPKLVISDKRRIDFGAAKNIGDEEAWQGQAHDLFGFDEAAHFAEQQIRFLMTWNRSTKPGQRCRIVMATNPPVNSVGLWLVEFFAPWLDPRHPHPAAPGELRWYVTDQYGKDLECPGPDYVLVDGKRVKPLSRTFIPASYSDNPFLGADYSARLDSLPEPYRSAFRDGNFMLGLQDDLKQVIPTDWVRQAQGRWTPQPPRGVPMCAIGVDVARGGQDDTVLAPRYDAWFAPLVRVPGVKTPLGSDVAGLVVTTRRDSALVIIDMGGGYGGAPYEHLANNGFDSDILQAYNGAMATNARTRDGKLGFTNVRSMAIWRFRELLDPDQLGGSPCALPDDPRLVADLTAPRFEITSRGIKVEAKEDVCDRIKRSTDAGDSVVMSWTGGPKMATHGPQWMAQGDSFGTPIGHRRTPQVVMGHRQQRRG